MNDLIKGTDHAEALAEFQRARKLGSKDFEHGTVTQGWWYGFLQRHNDKIVTKQGERFACNRHQWTSYANVKQMYYVIYDEMVNVRIAIRLEKEIYLDTKGNEVPEKEAYGFAIDVVNSRKLPYLCRRDRMQHFIEERRTHCRNQKHQFPGRNGGTPEA